MTPERRIGLLAALATLAALAAVTFAVYLPAFDAGFVWDDDDWLTENPDVSGDGGWSRIWGGPVRIQYYPVLFTAFRLQHALWGYDPLGYHAVNVTLHALNAFLVGLILRRLEVRRAWWVAALFALHPVHVESVAWVTELKNVLSGFFYLGAMLAFTAFDRSRRTTPYALSLTLFAAAMLAKTATATLPVALGLLILFRRQRLAGSGGPARIPRRDLFALAPFFAVALGLALVTIALEEGLIDVVRADFELDMLQRAGVASRALFFYPLKLLVPYPLIFNYPRWDVSAGALAVGWPLIPLAGCAVGGFVAWLRGYRGAAIALAFYLVTISPALGFFNVYAFRYSFVADHFQYLASLGILILLVAAGGALTQRLPWKRAGRVTGIAVLAVAAALTFQQARAYRDASTLWRDTLAKNPDSWIAHHNLASLMLAEGRVEEALTHFDEAVRCKPEAAESFLGRGMALARLGRTEAALAALDAAVRLAPRYPQARLQRGIERARTGRFAGAVEDLDLFLQANPWHLPALGARATARTALGRLDEALSDLDVAVEAGAGLQGRLDRATLRLRLGRLDGAAADIQAARSLAPEDPRADVLQGLLERERGSLAAACRAWSRACGLGNCELFRRYCGVSD